MSKSMNVAVVQATPVLFDLLATLEKVEQLTANAVAQGAEFILFPESFLPAYPRGLSFGSVVGSRSEQGREDWLLYAENAVEIPGPAVDYLGAIAQTNNCWLAIGVTERSADTYTLYCSLLYFNPAGELVQHHRKLKPTAAERIIWGEGRGDDLGVIDTPFGKTGGLICWENYMPLARMALYQQNVQLYLAPTADHRNTWTASMQHIACEGRCFVISCNQFVRKSDYPERFQYELAHQPEIMSKGGSMIVNPLGQIIAGPVYGQETILFATLDPDDIIRSRLDFDVVGHYSRKDVFFAEKK